MAKAKKVRKIGGRVYLVAALLCEKILHEKDEVASAIRIIDRINIPAEINLHEVKPVYPIQLLVMFKTIDFRGAKTLKIVMNRSDGQKEKVAQMPVSFQGEEMAGVSLHVGINLRVERAGISRLDLFLDGKRVTQLPLQVAILPPAEAAKDAADKAK